MQTEQTPKSNTEVRARTNRPIRHRIEPYNNDTISNRSKQTSIKPIALKYSVLALGRETPNGYQYSSTIDRQRQAANGKSYNLTDPTQNFRESESIKLIFEVSQPGYLKHVHKTKWFIYWPR